MIKAFPKIFALGTDYIRDIFSETVEVSEKIDGSQFGFGKIGGEVFMRSKGAQLFVDAPQAMFREGMDYISSIQDRLPEGVVFYGEYLKTPKHNTIKYSRIPKNHIILFGSSSPMGDKFDTAFEEYGPEFGLEVVPKWFSDIASPADLVQHLERDSCLGGAKVEGVVVKNYKRPFLLGGQPIPIMAGKFVSEAFKESHAKEWGENKSGSKWEAFKQGFCTEARWRKAIQHLAEKGELENQPRDIGKLMKEIFQDIEDEEEGAVKDWLWREYKGELLRSATHGFPEWYKRQLLERSFGV